MRFERSARRDRRDFVSPDCATIAARCCVRGRDGPRPVTPCSTDPGRSITTKPPMSCLLHRIPLLRPVYYDTAGRRCCGSGPGSRPVAGAVTSRRGGAGGAAHAPAGESSSAAADLTAPPAQRRPDQLITAPYWSRPDCPYGKPSRRAEPRSCGPPLA